MADLLKKTIYVKFITMISNLDNYTTQECERIAKHNDALRKYGVGGIVFFEDHFLNCSLNYQCRVLDAIRDDRNLTGKNQYRQAGSVGIDDQSYAWNISAYNRHDLSDINVDPLDPIKSFREMVVFKLDVASGQEGEYYTDKLDRRKQNSKKQDGILKIHVPIEKLKIEVTGDGYRDFGKLISRLLSGN